MITNKALIRIIILMALFGLLWTFTPLWVRGGVLGFFIAIIMNALEVRSEIMDKYEERLRKLKR